MSMAKDTACSSCHGELGPDINGCIMCYGCGSDERLPVERRHKVAAPIAPAPKAVVAPPPKLAPAPPLPCPRCHGTGMS